MSRASSCLLLVPALCLAACQDEGIHPIGIHYRYVVSEASVPTTSAQAAALGLDLDGDEVVDNQLGAVLGGLASLATPGMDVQAAITRAIDRGDLLLLLDLQANSLSRWDPAGLQVELGDPASATPAPCADPADAVCRRHLDGTGTFRVAAGSPEHFPLVGEVADRAFDGGPGDLTLELPLGGSARVRIDLIGARAKMFGIADDRVEDIILAGALPDESYRGVVFPALFEALLAPRISADCPGTTPPACGCTPGSTGRTIIDLFDKSPQDCVVTVAEMLNNPAAEPLVGDLIIDGQRAHSFGMKVSAVKAQLPLL